MLHNPVSNSALSPSSSLSGIGWMASDPDNLLVLLRTFSLPSFLFILIPFPCSSLSPIQSSFSSHRLPSLPLQTWLLLTLSCALGPSSPLPLYQPLIFHPCLQHFWFLLPSPLFLFSPVVSEVIFSQIPALCFSSLSLLQSTENTEKRACSLIMSSRLSSNAGWMPSSALPASTKDFNWTKTHFHLQKMQTLEHYLLHHSSLHCKSSASSIFCKLPRVPC